MASSFTAVFDSCVLFSAPLRDLLLQLSVTDLFRARWTKDIHREWMDAVHRRRGKPMDRLEATREKMDASVLDCVVTGYEDLIPGLTLPDPVDRHVLAAAIRAGADVIVTRNLRDFPDSTLWKYGIEAQHPDEFVVNLLGLSPGPVCQAVKTIRARLAKPPRSVDEYLAKLEEQDLFKTVEILRTFSELL